MKKNQGSFIIRAWISKSSAQLLINISPVRDNFSIETNTSGYLQKKLHKTNSNALKQIQKDESLAKESKPTEDGGSESKNLVG